MMQINDLIKKRREDLHLSQEEVANFVGLSIYAYYDIEALPDEITTAVKLSVVKKLCSILSIDFLSLFQINCYFCQTNDFKNEEYELPRNILIKNRRKALKFSKSQLSDMIGFYENAITDLENSKNYLEDWPISIIAELSSILNIPLQILVDVTCPTCLERSQGGEEK